MKLSERLEEIVPDTRARWGTMLADAMSHWISQIKQLEAERDQLALSRPRTKRSEVMPEVLTLDWGGESCEIVITTRHWGREEMAGHESVSISFKGNPTFELSELRALLKRAEQMAPKD